MSLLELFCHVDDFWLQFGPQWERELLVTGAKHRRRAGQLCPSEIMTILVYFHQMRYRDFKTYYIQFVQVYLRSEFPHLVSYHRFVELMPSVLVPLCAYLRSCYGECTSISFIDSTPIACATPAIVVWRTSWSTWYAVRLPTVINPRSRG